MEERLYTSQEAALALGVVVPTIYRWVQNGLLPGASYHCGIRQLGFRIPESSLLALRDRGRCRGTGQTLP
jgi:excisionase family DNA binding protein